MANCSKLKGRKLRKCMEAYVKQSKKTFPSFNQETDTAYNAIEANSRSLVEKMRKNKRNTVVQNNLKDAVKEKLVKSNDPNAKYPFRLKVLKKKKK
jgi:hypothetical protein